jgi:osmotically-inducible protein OsmY
MAVMMKTLVIAVLTLALVGTSVAQERDQTLEDAVWAELESEKLDKEVAEVVAIDGEVTLRGKPANALMKMKAIEAALAVEGVTGVTDELEVAGPESQEELVNALVSRVLTYPNFTVFDDVGFQIEEGGIVVLTGWVTEPFKKTELGERVATVRGVTELENVIEVLPVGGSDDRLRRTLFDNIYGDQLFVQYANRAHPPIRIIVNRGKVILAGAVRNRIEKLKAETIARGTFGVINVDNRLQINP